MLLWAHTIWAFRRSEGRDSHPKPPVPSPASLVTPSCPCRPPALAQGLTSSRPASPTASPYSHSLIPEPRSPRVPAPSQPLTGHEAGAGQLGRGQELLQRALLGRRPQLRAPLSDHVAGVKLPGQDTAVSPGRPRLSPASPGPRSPMRRRRGAPALAAAAGSARAHRSASCPCAAAAAPPTEGAG